MPALPNVANVLRVTLKHSSAADVDVESRFFFKYTGTAPTSAQLGTFASSINTSWGTNVKALATSSITLVETTVTDLTSPSSGQGVSASGTAGTRSGAALPLSNAVLNNLVIARRYRGGKPRQYLPYGSVTDLATTQSWTTSFQTAFNTGWGNFITAIQGLTWSSGSIVGPVNVSYYDGFTSVQNPVTLRWRNIPTLRVTPVVDTVLTYAMSLTLATQRKRNRR